MRHHGFVEEITERDVRKVGISLRPFYLVGVCHQHAHGHGIGIFVGLHQLFVESLQVVGPTPADGIVEFHSVVVAVLHRCLQRSHRRVCSLGITHVHQHVPHVVTLFGEQHLCTFVSVQHVARRTVGIQIRLRLLHSVNLFRQSEAVVVGANHDVILLQRDDVSLYRILDDVRFVSRRCLVSPHHRGMIQQQDACRFLLPVVDVIGHEDSSAHRDAVARMQGIYRTVVKRQSPHARTVHICFVVHDARQSVFCLLAPYCTRQDQQRYGQQYDSLHFVHIIVNRQPFCNGQSDVEAYVRCRCSSSGRLR